MPRRKKTDRKLVAARAVKRAACQPQPPAPVEAEEHIQPVVGLQRRIEAFTSADNSAISSVVKKSVLLSVDILEKIAKIVQCVDCGETGAVAIADPRKLSPTVEFKCSACSAVFFSEPGASATSVDGKHLDFDGKKICLVHDSLMNGGGYAGYCDTSIRLGVSGLAKCNYYKYVSFLLKEMDAYHAQMRPKVLQGLKDVYSKLRAGEEGDEQRQEDGILDVDVTYDGTWMTRGHRSHIGVGFVMDSETGAVLDFEVMSNFCQKYFVKEKTLTPEEFAAWKEGHVFCTKNFDGKSGMMETEAAVRMWSRSEALGFRYVSFIGDGDSSAFRAVSALNDGAGPYDSCTVVKEECINHFAKRLSTRLLGLKKSLRVPIVTKTGKTQMRSVLAGRHGLTDNNILALQSHLQQNIWKQQPTDTLSDLRNRILSSYYHGTSTDEDPRHEHCPEGPDSWCFYQKASALGEQPDSHSAHRLYLAGLSVELRREILKVYLDLTSQDLLKRCLKKKTQNSNESLHSKLWRKCLKVKHAGLHRVKYAAHATTLDHNFGSRQGSLITALGLLNEDALHAKEKKDRTPLRPPRQKRRRVDATDEPGPSTGYAPGQF